MRIIMKRIYITLLILIALTACRKAYEVTGEDYSEYGWDFYIVGDYTQARRWFIESVMERPGYSDGWNGTGWTMGKLDSVANSLYYFRQGLYVTDTLESEYSQMLAGLTFSFHAVGQWDSCLTRGNELLYRDSSWVFVRYSGLTHESVRVTMSSAAFNKGDFNLSLTLIQYFDSTFQPDISTQLGIAQLTAKIEELNLIYR